MREDFEKLPEIAARLSEYKIVFHDNDYAAEGYSDNTKLWMALGFVNGSWYAFQEQQKKIDEIVSIVREADLSDGDSSVAIVHDEIQELLK